MLSVLDNAPKWLPVTLQDLQSLEKGCGRDSLILSVVFCSMILFCI